MLRVLHVQTYRRHSPDLDQTIQLLLLFRSDVRVRESVTRRARTCWACPPNPSTPTRA